MVVRVKKKRQRNAPKKCDAGAKLLVCLLNLLLFLCSRCIFNSLICLFFGVSGWWWGGGGEYFCLNILLPPPSYFSLATGLRLNSLNGLFSGLFSGGGGGVCFRKRILGAITRGLENKYNLKLLEIIMMFTA